MQIKREPQRTTRLATFSKNDE